MNILPIIKIALSAAMLKNAHDRSANRKTARQETRVNFVNRPNISSLGGYMLGGKVVSEAEYQEAVSRLLNK